MGRKRWRRKKRRVTTRRVRTRFTAPPERVWVRTARGPLYP